MHIPIRWLCIMAFGVVVVFGAAPACATQMLSGAGCLDKASELKTKPSRNADSPNRVATVREREYGRDRCLNRYYQSGVGRYVLPLGLQELIKI